MSSLAHAGQYNHTFSAKRLCNWEVPAQREKAIPSKVPMTTHFIASDNGHLIGRKKMISFETGYETSTSNRWPDKRQVSADSYPGAATMGFR